MPNRNNISICISLAVVFSLLFMCMPSAAVTVDLTEGELLNSQAEGEIIQYIIDISGIPKQTRIIEMSTDLIPVAGTNLWQPAGEGFAVTGEDSALNNHKIELTDSDGFSDKISVTVYGKAPVLTTVEVVDGVVVTKIHTQTSGYVYYHIQTLDENRDILGNTATETFSIVIPDDQQFQSRLNAVPDTKLRALIDGLYSKGLRDEAKNLLAYAESPQEASLPVASAAIIGIVLLVIGFAAGVVLGQIRAKNMQDFQSEYKGD
ncbi:MAG: hypothetical protein PHP13_06550 [Methanomicrobium sp.]|nr:hypothetical protein [Methanomicrobium sp.]MDD4300048.1 hypothetical protein [Methanomicrobium sp.]